MRGFFTLIIICFLITPNSANAFPSLKTDESLNTIEQIDKELEQKPKNKELLNLALELSIKDKNWDKAIYYNDRLLEMEPKSQAFLLNSANFYLMKKDTIKAIEYYKMLVKLYHKMKYKQELAKLYMKNNDFESAQEVLEPVYYKNSNDPQIIKDYLDILIEQEKIYDAYEIIRNNNLLDTKEGYIVLGDLALINEKYADAASKYYKALELDPENIILKNKLALSYRKMGNMYDSSNIYHEVLREDPGNLEARLGLGFLEINKKDFKRARQIFCSILKEDPDSKQAKLAIVASYIAGYNNLLALEALSKMPEDDDVRLMRATIYYNIGMPSSALKALSNTQEAGPSPLTEKRSENKSAFDAFSDVSEGPARNETVPESGYESSKWNDELKTLSGTIYKDDETLKHKIKRISTVTITPVYSFFFQKLNDEFRLNYQKYGLEISKRTEGNANVFLDYNVYWYSSGTPFYANNVTNEFRGGVQARPTEKWEYRADLGVKVFEFGNGAMLLTDSWIRHYFSDKLNLKLGFKRNNLEQSFLSAVGRDFNGLFTGRVADTRIYLEYEGKLPYRIYTYGRGVSGFMFAQNLRTNPYFEATLGIGRLFYNNPRNKWINTFAVDVVTFNTSYQYNLLNLYDRAGVLFGGYFSPSYYNATTINFKAEGNLKKWRLKYGLKGFGGVQTSMSPDSTTPTWGVEPYLSYEINDYVTVSTSFSHFTYADIERNLFIINAVIRPFR